MLAVLNTWDNLPSDPASFKQKPPPLPHGMDRGGVEASLAEPPSPRSFLEHDVHEAEHRHEKSRTIWRPSKADQGSPRGPLSPEARENGVPSHDDG